MVSGTAARAARPPKVLLLVSPSEHTMFNRMNLLPFGPGIVAANLRDHGIDVDLHDLNSTLWRMSRDHEFGRADLKPFYEERSVVGFVRGEPHEYLDTFAARLLRGVDPAAYDVVGISAGADFSWLEIHAASVVGAHIKRHYGKPVVLGGNNLEYMMQFKEVYATWWNACLDEFSFMVNGPGEDTFLELVESLAGGRTVLPMAGTMTPGVVRRLAGRVTRPPDAIHKIIPPDFDGLLLEDYHNFVRQRPDASPRQQASDEAWNLTQIFRWPASLSWVASEMNAETVGRGTVGKLLVPYVFNYNCPYNCAFCTESLDRIKLVHAQTDQVIEHMVGLTTKYDTPYIHLFNNYFNLLNGFVEEFASRVVLGGVKFHWSDCARFNGLDYEKLALLADSGCRKLTFGMETASTTMLKVIDKRLKLSEAERVLRWCKEVGIWADLEIITGLPHEDESEFRQTTAFLERNAEYINYFNINRFFVAPRSLMGAKPEAYGMKLIVEPDAYQRLLDANYAWISDETHAAPRPQNFRVYDFDEIDGRPAAQIAEETAVKIAKLNDIQDNDFRDAYRMLNVKRQRQIRARSNPDHPHMAPA